MILTLDIGNTNIKTALFEGMEMRQYWRISTDRQRSSDELGLLLMNLLQYNRIDRGQIDGIMMSSVVPQINFTVEHMCRNYFGIEPMKIEPGVRTGINIKYENPRELGSDRIANAVAAYESAKANVAMSKADLAQAELELSYTTVRSPIDGYISERYADIGTLVGPGGKSQLATIVESDEVLVDFSLTALDYLRSQQRNVTLGEKDANRSWQPSVTITLADNSIYPLTGIVDFADPQVNPQTGTFGVRAELPNPDRKLLPGQFTKVKLLLDVRENAIVVPSKAVAIEKGGAYIYVVRRDSTAEKRFIETGPEVNNHTVVERGLGPDELVVVEGYHKLTPGALVKPVSPEMIKEEEVAL